VLKHDTDTHIGLPPKHNLQIQCFLAFSAQTGSFLVCLLHWQTLVCVNNFCIHDDIPKVQGPQHHMNIRVHTDQPILATSHDVVDQPYTLLQRPCNRQVIPKIENVHKTPILISELTPISE